MTAKPSYSYFGTYDNSAYPFLWQHCVRAIAPCLGASRNLIDHSRRGVRVFLSGSAGHLVNGWVRSNGQWAFYPLAGGSPIFTIGASMVGKSTVIGSTRLWSVSQWMHPLEHTSGQVIYLEGTNSSSTTARAGLVTGSSGAVTINIRNTDGGSTQTWTTNGVTPLNQWSHVAASINKWTGTLRAWINGVEQTFSTTGTVDVGDWSTTETHTVMRWASTFGGYVDDVMVWHRTLATNEVSLLAKYRGIAYTPREPITSYHAAGSTPAASTQFFFRKIHSRVLP